ncbi:hypothetical protein AVEN_84439-1 [Araneus ventricosus]|uniref:Uncharacterized protein n=1 Tax=Araneus ventricosus TaxID=182803 RepID=A0A4Y2R1R1_ARAVE|nr:hypothetical protein AVEN_84439-1 [Araneus ventricosus]
MTAVPLLRQRPGLSGKEEKVIVVVAAQDGADSSRCDSCLQSTSENNLKRLRAYGHANQSTKRADFSSKQNSERTDFSSKQHTEGADFRWKKNTRRVDLSSKQNTKRCDFS